MDHIYVECDCSSSEHVVRFTRDSDEVYPHIYMSVQLSTSNKFFRRLWQAIKYVFGYECKYGHWDEVMLTEESVKKLRNLCDGHLEDWEKYKNTK